MKKQILAAILFALFLGIPAYSQSNASMSGIVTDATQAVLPGVTVTATNLETGIARTAKTNAAGLYSFAGMQVGLYKVSAELAGFQTKAYQDVKLGNDAQMQLNITMEIRKLEESVEVSYKSDAVSLDTSSSPGVTLPEKSVATLPIVNSNVLSLIKVMGGVTVTENPIWAADDTQFAGVSAANVNLTRDGVSVNDVRYATGLNSPVYLNPEMVGEFKMVLAPVDAEMGRGNGQVQVVTRSGGNAYHGSAVWNLQNSFLDAQEWGDNKRGIDKTWRNQNEYTLSFGGPILKSKTFFFVSWDHQYSRIKQNDQNPQVPTACARKGIWRWFDGWSGGNIMTKRSEPLNPGFFQAPVVATVNADGSPVTGLTQPNSTTPAQLHHASLFGPLLKTPQSNDCSDVTIDDATGFPTSDWVDYAHPTDALHTLDTTGYVKKFMQYIPLPNNFQVGDGLNWGGKRWTRTLSGADNIYGIGEGPNRKQITFRIDHNFNPSHRLSGTYSWEKDVSDDSFATMPQNSYGGSVYRKPQQFVINVVSTLRPTLLNEFRFGMSRTASHTYNPIDNPDTGNELRDLLLSLYPTASGTPVIIGLGSSPGFAVSNINVWGGGRGSLAASWGGHDPRWTYADNVTWTKGRHSWRFGIDVQRSQSYQEINGSSALSIPYVTSPGATFSGYAANSGFHTGWMGTASAALPGAVGNQWAGNVITGAYNLLNLYAGAVSNVSQWRFINSPTATSYNDIAKGEYWRITDYRQNQLGLFAQDDWRVTDALTLNLGLRYEWTGLPYLRGGMTAGLKGGALAAFGRSGRTFDSWMKPGTVNEDGSINYAGEDAELAFIGPDSPNPNQQLYNDDFNNIGPVFGFAWQLPWGGKGKTVIRGGYQLSYMGGGRADNFNAMPQITYTANYRQSSNPQYMNLSTLPQILPVIPIESHIKTPAQNPVLPVQQRSNSITVSDPNLRTPYTQNLRMTLTRTITSNISLDVQYVGTLQRKQVGSIDLNSPNIWNNGLKEAFDTARYGGESELLDRMFKGVNVAGNSYGPVGTVYNGVLQTGAMHLRGYTDFWNGTASDLANGNYISLARKLATMNYTVSNPGNNSLPVIPQDTRGTILRMNGFPENFIFTSPQFSSVNWRGNFNNSNYHSMQATLTVRPTHGFNVMATYTWSRSLGNQGYTDPRFRDQDYGLSGMNRTHQVAINGAFELPFGPGRWLLNGNHGLVSRLVGGWQMAWIGNYATGMPFSISPTNTTLYGNARPNRVGDFDPKSGEVVWLHGAASGNYFWDEQLQAPKYVLVPDPQCANVTTAQSLQTNCSLRAFALARDNSQLIFTNPYPTERGNFDMNQLLRPAVWGADMTMSKTIKLTEGKTFQIRVDATNIFNHAQASGSSFQTGVGRTRVPYGPVASMNYSYDSVDGTWVYRPLGYLNEKVGSRTFQARLRLDF